MIRLIASDMDGTLLNEKITVAKATAEAIRQAQAAGIEFIVATGRNLPQAQPALLAHDLHPAYITINGALVYNEAQTVTNRVPIPVPKLAALFDLFDQTGLYYEISAPSGVISNSEASRRANIEDMFHKQDPHLPAAQVRAKADAHLARIHTSYVSDYRPLLKSDPEDLYKVVIFSDAEQAGLAPIKTAVEQLGGLVVTSSGANNLEINDVRAQKGPALVTYAKQRGYRMDEVMAIGDNLNDESMIRAAKYSVAMGNAIPLIKRLAWHTTATNREDGVAKAIYHAIALNAAESQGERHAVLY